MLTPAPVTSAPGTTTPDPTAVTVNVPPAVVAIEPVVLNVPVSAVLLLIQ